jgi:hypothetical protein
MKSWANILLGVWLVAGGLMSLADLHFSGSYTILAIIAIAAGILLLLADRNVKISARLGDVVLGVWLIAAGLFPLLNIHFHGSRTVLDVLMLAAGVLILIRR